MNAAVLRRGGAVADDRSRRDDGTLATGARVLLGGRQCRRAKESLLSADKVALLDDIATHLRVDCRRNKGIPLEGDGTAFAYSCTREMRVLRELSNQFFRHGSGDLDQVVQMRIGRLWPGSKRRSERPRIVDVDAELGLEAFGLESERSSSDREPSTVRAFAQPPARVLRSPRFRTALVITLGLMAMAGGYWFRERLLARLPVTGSITFETQPAGLEVFVAGRSVGRTPVTLALPPGPYDVRLGAGAAARAARVAVVSGTSIVQHYEMSAPPPPSTGGSVRVQTEPTGLPVLLDGVENGISPASLEHVSAGDHEIAVRVGDALVKRAVHVASGETTSVIITSAPRAEPGLVAVGWLAVTCPVAVQVREGGRVVGASELDRMMMPSGDHDLEFVSDALGFKTTRRVKIASGKVTATKIDVPDGKMNLNALPWAEVFIDGERVGLTPIGNLSRAIGRHEVVFRHPDLGERRAFITVTTQETARLGVDLRKP